MRGWIGKATTITVPAGCSTYVRPTRPTDIPSVARRMRAADRLEIQTSHPQWSAEQALYASWSVSDLCFTLADKAEGLPILMFGLARHRGRCRDIVWLLATEDLKKYKVDVMRLAREHWLGALLFASGRGLENIVDRRNDLHIRWLRKLGFKKGVTVDVNGFPFIHMYHDGEQ